LSVAENYGATMNVTPGPAPIRWGIAATGKIAASMCEALETLPDAEVVAVGSRTQTSADAFAAPIRHPPRARHLRRASSPIPTSTWSTSRHPTAIIMR
jgi:hypothetical protein